jgi:hypothetical protein
VAVECSESDTVITLAGDEACGFERGDRLDLYRGGKYVGFARVMEVTATVGAQVVDSFCADQPVGGDVGISRPSAEVGGCRVGRVFRAERDYCLVTLGRADGVERNDVLFAGESGRDEIPLVVKRVYPDHCGAQLRMGDGEDAAGLTLWMPVYTEPATEGDGRDCRRTVRDAPDARTIPGVPWLYEVGQSLPARLQVGDVIAAGTAPARIAVVAVVLSEVRLAVRVDHLGR